MGALLTWYLIVNYHHGGAIFVPQIDQKQCLDNRAFIIEREKGNPDSVSVYCIPGRSTGR